MEKLDMQTPNIADKNYEALSRMFPNAVTETIDENGEVVRAIDADVLRQEISCKVVEGKDERYQFTWPDKRNAILLANSPISSTLRPVAEESVDFENTENLYIEGDNLDVLKLLQETYLNKIKMIYIDPPYNTGSDFVYMDNFHQSIDEYVKESGQVDDLGNKMVTNTETNGRYHTDWLNMMYPRLKMARNLLSEDGAIFISIDDHEQERLKILCDEIFGESNFIGRIAVVNNLKGRNDKKDIATCHEYLLIYGKSEFAAGGMPLSDEQRAKFDKVDNDGNQYQLRDLRKRGRPDRREDRPNMYFPIFFNEATGECSLEEHDGWVKILPLRGDGSDGRWRWGRERVEKNLAILEPRYSKISKRWGIEHRVYLNPSLNDYKDDDEDEQQEERASKSKSFWMGGELSTDVGRRELKKLFDTPYFDYPKSVEYIINTLYMGTSDDSIVMDFFSGSATTAQAVMQLNASDGGKRKFIMVQIPEPFESNTDAYKDGYKNICDVGKERIRRAAKSICDESVDTGFRVLKLDSTNMKDVYYHPSDTQQTLLDMFADNIKEDRTPEDLLFQVMLDLGILLSSKIEEKEIAGKKVFNVADGFLIACFDKDITDETIKAVANMKPYYAVFRDSSMANDSVATNFDQIFANISPDTIRKVL